MKQKESIELYKNEIIPIEHGEFGLMVNSRILHQRLRAGTRYNDWMARKIEQYGFVEGEDFYSNLSKSTGGRPQMEYLITLDMAKELAMLEENNFGRNVRRYFIEIEKQYRDWIGFVLPRLEKDVDLFSEKIGYNYLQLLSSVHLSTRSGAVNSRKNRNPQEFWRNQFGVVFVSEEYGKNIIAFAAARKLSHETKVRRLIHEAQKMLTEIGQS